MEVNLVKDALGVGVLLLDQNVQGHEHLKVGGQVLDLFEQKRLEQKVLGVLVQVEQVLENQFYLLLVHVLDQEHEQLFGEGVFAEVVDIFDEDVVALVQVLNAALLRRQVVDRLDGLALYLRLEVLISQKVTAQLLVEIKQVALLDFLDLLQHPNDVLNVVFILSLVVVNF